MYKKDLEFGFKQENDLFSKIKDKYGENITATNRWSLMDYENEDIIIELKSRRNRYAQYPTTMISKSKIDHMLQSGKKSIALFNFIDGVYNIEIDKNIINQFELRTGGRTDRGRRELNDYYFIPIDLLKKLE